MDRHWGHVGTTQKRVGETFFNKNKKNMVTPTFTRALHVGKLSERKGAGKILLKGDNSSERGG